MAKAVKKTISLEPDIAREMERKAREEGKTLSIVIQDNWRAERTARLRAQLTEIQGYFSKQLRDKGIFTEDQLMRYLEE